MKNLLVIAAFLLFFTGTAMSVEVRGYDRDSDRDGFKEKHVDPYLRTNPNNSRTDNYSTPGNYNPNKGSINPPSSSPKENYPTNPRPYESKKW